jgi:hypothetical protein
MADQINSAKDGNGARVQRLRAKKGIQYCKIQALLEDANLIMLVFLSGHVFHMHLQQQGQEFPNIPFQTHL